MLQKNGASGILMEYEKGTGRVESLLFKIDFEGRPMGFRLPIRWREAKRTLVAQGVTRAKGDDDYCYRVAWRIVRNWLEQQMAILALEMADLAEIFLPYSVSNNGQTFYQNILNNPQLLLNAGLDNSATH